MRALRTGVPVFVFGAAAIVLFREVRDMSAVDVLAGMASLSPLAFLFAAGFTVLSYCTLVGYDYAGLRYVGKPVPFRQTRLVSFIAYAFSNNIGLAGMGGAPLRYRYFVGLGISGGDVLRVVAFGYVTFWVGFLALAGVLFGLEPLPVPEFLDLPWADTRPLGLLFIAMLATYMVWGARAKRMLRIGRWRLPAPGPRMSWIQIALGAADWILAGAALYALLPAEANPGIVGFFVVYLFAQTAGLVSTVPGGLGVFETVTALFLANEQTAPALLGALLLYRIVYYLIPLAVAVVMLVAIQVREHRDTRAPSPGHETA